MFEEAGGVAPFDVFACNGVAVIAVMLMRSKPSLFFHHTHARAL
jgi:hypothetical protein